MRKDLSLVRGAAWLTAAAVVAISGRAAAQACPTGANVVYMDGSSAFKPVVIATQVALGSSVQLVYFQPGSCEGIAHVLGEGAGPTKELGTGAGTPNLVTPSAMGGLTPCTIPAAGADIDIGISDVYASTCAATFDTSLAVSGLGTTAKDFLGPIQAMTFVNPTQSTSYNSISAEAAYMVFGFDADTQAHTIAPWAAPLNIFVRFWDSGTLEMIGQAINLPGGKWKNATNTMAPLPAQQATGSGDMVNRIKTAAMTPANVDSTIGILGAANVYSNSMVVKPLAFQASGESCAFYPDSSSSATDKLNVRQGRYAIWGPEHLIANVDSMGNPVGVSSPAPNSNTPAVQAVVAALTASMTGPTNASVDGGTGLNEAAVKALIDGISKPGTSGGVIPWCAMEVSRTSEIGPISSYQSPYPCTCEYESAAFGTTGGVHAHACTSCKTDMDCADAGASLTHCRYGFCEAN